MDTTTLADADIRDAMPSPEPMPKTPGALVGRMWLPSDFPELRLFALLLARFCRPNGPMTLCLRNPNGDPDAPIKWDFLFVPFGQLRLQVLRHTTGVEAWWWGADATNADVLAYLVSNLQRHADTIDEVIQTLEKHTLILNPFVRHKCTAVFACDALSQLDPVRPQAPKGEATREQLMEYASKMEEFGKAVERQASLMMLVVSESAFMAEAFLNLLLAFLMRKEIRTSRTIRTETLMRKWRSKIERLHVDCDLIRRPADLGDVRMANAKRMFDMRNQLAHPYPHPEEMAIGQMWFFNCFPVLETAVSFETCAIAPHNQLPSPEEARFCKNAADELIGFLQDLIDPRARDEVLAAIDSNPIGYDMTRQVYSIPFSNVLLMGVLSPRE